MDRQNRQNSLLAGIYPLNRRPGSAGLTIVETLIATVIVVITLLVSASYFTSQGNQIRNLASSGSCKLALEAQMGFLRQQSVSPFGTDWTDPTATGNEIAENAGGSLLPADQDLLTPGAGGVYQISSAALQNSSLGAIARIYNSPGGATDVTIPGLPAPTGLRNFAWTATVVTYNIDTGLPQAPIAMPVILKPRAARDASDPAVVNPPLISFPDNVTDDLGFRVTLNGSYDDNGVVRNCRLTEDFRYPVDHEVKAPSVIMNLYDVNDAANMVPATALCPESNTISSRDEDRCQQHRTPMPQLTLKIGFRQPSPATPDVLPAEPGTMYLCRDVSEQRLLPATSATGIYCSGDPGASMQLRQVTAGGWVPCSQVTACGVPSTTRNFTPATNEYTLTYQATQPSDFWGCDVKIDVASIDLAGNFKRLSDLNIAGTAVRQNSAAKYFQGVDCWECSKKKRSFGSFLAVAFLGGLVGLAIFCAVGNCIPKRYRFSHNSCDNDSRGRILCKRRPMNFPNWWNQTRSWSPTCQTGTIIDPPPGLPCEALNGLYPVPAGTSPSGYQLPAVLDGETTQASYSSPATGIFCAAEATCQNGTYVGLIDESNNPTPIASCYKMVTRKRIDISGLNAGQIPNIGNTKTDCVFPSPINFDIPANFSFNYYLLDQMRVCQAGFAGVSQPVLCRPGAGSTTRWPRDQETSAFIKDPTKYIYYEHNIPTPPNLQSCEDVPL